jgi:hypothetical protein
MDEEQAGNLYEWAVEVVLRLRNNGPIEYGYGPDQLNIDALIILNDRNVWIQAATSIGGSDGNV